MIMEAYRMNSKGEMERIEPLKELPIGTKICAFGAGMSDQIFCVTGPMTARGQEMCLISKWYPEAYFSSPRHYFDKHSRPLSKKFGIGFYWDDVDNVVYPQSKVEAAKRRADIIERKIAEREEARRLADKKEIEELPGRFPHLKEVSKKSDYMELRSNILAHMKHLFPEVKFSIKKRSDSSIYIYWTDGVVTDKVCKATGIFEDHETDYTGDYRDYNPSNFNYIFGGMNYIFPEREMSEEVRALSKLIEEELNLNEFDASVILRKVWAETEFPAGAKNIRLEVVNQGWRDEDRYKIRFDVEEPKKAEPKPTNASIRIIDYSPKSIAVIGDTKPLKDHLKKLGGSFNPRLNCGAGWIFSNTKKEAVVSALGL